MAKPAPGVAALAQVVRERRKELGLTQEQVGDLHRNVVGEIERGLKSPTVPQLERLGHALGMRGSELLRLAEERTRSMPEDHR